MALSNISSKDGAPYEVLLTGHQSSSAFETAIKKHFRYTRSRDTKSVVFDLSQATGIDLLEVGLFATWIRIVSSKKHVRVILPSCKTFLGDMLMQHEFREFLSNAEVESDFPAKLTLNEYVPDNLPLRSNCDMQSKGRLDEISLRRQDAGGGTDALIAIRNVILDELYENIKLHAPGKCAWHVMKMETFRVTSERQTDDPSRWTLHQANCWPWEWQFFDRLLDHPDCSFVHLAVGDEGDGITRVLGKSPAFRDLDEINLLDVAFRYEVTGDPEARRARILKAYSSIPKEKLAEPPGTGLYWVARLVNRFHGMLTVRSGHTYLTYDFLSYPQTGHPTQKLLSNMTLQEKSSRKHWSKLTAFPGTHYDIYLPLNPASQLVATRLHRISSSRLMQAHSYELLRASDYFGGDDVQSQAEGLRCFLADFDPKLSRADKALNKHDPKIILVDFGELGTEIGLFTKTWSFLAREIQRSQSTSKPVICVGVSEEQNTQLGIALPRPEDDRPPEDSELALTAISDELEIAFHGVAPKTGSLLVELARGPRDITDAEVDGFPLYQSQPHLVCVQGGKILVGLQIADVVKTTIEELKAKLREEIKATPGVYHTDAKVRTTSGFYVQGFFEIHRIFANLKWRKRFLRWLRASVRAVNAKYIVAVGHNVSSVLKENSAGFPPVVALEDPEGTAVIALILSIPTGQPVAIVTDVISSAKTLKPIAAFFKNRNSCTVFTVVDARPDEDHGITAAEISDVSSIMRHPLAIYNTRPGTWHYESIQEVDKSNNTLLTKAIQPPEDPIWQKVKLHNKTIRGKEVQDVKNDFFRKVAVDAPLIHKTHVRSPGYQHITYYYDIENLVHWYDGEILEKILSDLRSIGSDPRSNASIKVTHILYPEYNPGMKALAEALGKALGRVILVPISMDHIKNTYTEQEWSRRIDKANCVIILDDSLCSGFTQRRMIDIAWLAKANSAYAYVLTSRADPLSLRFLCNVTNYGIKPSMIVRIKHLCDARIPTYTDHDCPICAYMRHLLDLHAKLSPIKEMAGFILDGIDLEAVTLKPRDLAVAREYWRSAALLEEMSAEASARLAELRYLLELALSSQGVRNQLRRRVADNERIFIEQLCDLLEVLYHEFWTFFICRRNDYDEVFYRTLRENITKGIESLLDEPERLQRHLGAAIFCWFFLAPESFTENLSRTLTVVKNHNFDVFRKLLTYLTILLSLPESTMAGAVLDKLLIWRDGEGSKCDTDTLAGIRVTIDYFWREMETFSLPPVYQNYRAATNGPYLYDHIGGVLKSYARDGIFPHDFGEQLESAVVLLIQNLQGVVAMTNSKLLSPDEQGMLNPSSTVCFCKCSCCSQLRGQREGLALCPGM